MLRIIANVSLLFLGLTNGFSTARNLSIVTVNSRRIDVSLKSRKVKRIYYLVLVFHVIMLKYVSKTKHSSRGNKENGDLERFKLEMKSITSVMQNPDPPYIFPSIFLLQYRLSSNIDI